MMISTRGRYALRVIIDLAENQQDEGYIPLKDIAKRQNISEKYLESILKLLVRDGILVGLRGKGGGYRLTRPLESYTVACILRPTEGSLAPVACLDKNAPECVRTPMCRTLPVWDNLNKLVNDFFESITIADLIEGEPLPCPIADE